MKRAILLSAIAFAILIASFDSSASSSDANSQITFSKDVAPIFYDKCAACHRAGEIAPMSLVTYKESRPWAKSIREKVINRTMPPWHADAAHGRFSNDRSLTQKEIDTIVAWVDQGAREGNPKDLPAQPQFPQGWQIGKPDVVLTMLQDFTVPAEGVVDYKYFVIPTNFTEDKWVQAVEIRPGNRAVVHHVIAFVVSPDAAPRRRLFSVGEGFSGLAGTAPGEMPEHLPDGIGKKIKAGSYIVFQMHYTPNGTEQKDRTSIGLVFNRKPVEKELMGGIAINRRFAIPAGAENHQVQASYTFKEDSRILSLMPHMHLRGKSFEYRLIYPDGKSKTMLSVPKYDFNWQTRYELAEPVFAPKGSRMICTAHFDNSEKNKWNPDPTRTVRWGPQTWEEMMIGFIGFVSDKQNLQESAASSR